MKCSVLVYLPCLRYVLRAYFTFASKQAVSITLFGPRPNNKPRVLKITVTHAVCTWRCWTLPLLRFERKRMQFVYEFTLLNKILRNHLLSEHMQWDYTPLNVKINRLTSISSNEITKLPKYFLCGHSYLTYDHGILCHCVTPPLALDNWGQKYCETLGYKPNPSIPQCDFQCLILPTIQKYSFFFENSNNK